MALQPGIRLGPYKILSALGAGGMGEVYNARDTRLERTVAIKILPEVFAGDPDRLARFQREAQVLASLNDPHIGAIYGLEEANGVRALVLELVEGPTLADRIAAGAIPLGDALPIARQIADALEAAHERGIVHRDLKPANIKLRPDGTAKVLDFGLAKALEIGPGSGEASQSPTITSPAMTRLGTVMGTAAYMSPEQARGHSADKRSDVWAFGCVLYQMLTGKRAFKGDGMSDTIAAVLRADPDWTLLGPQVPEPITTLLRRCLEKDHKRRLRDIGDARLELDAGESATVGRVTTAGRLTERFAWMAALVVLALVALGFGVWAIRNPAVPNEVRLEFNPPATWDPLDLASLAVSPDGQSVVFVAAWDGQLQLCVRRLNSEDIRPLTGTEGAYFPFWSPDSRSIGFFADGLLKRIDLDGGLVRTLTAAQAGFGGSWNRDGVILFAPTPANAIFRVSAVGGGTPTEVTRLAEGHAGHTFPSFLPDGGHFLYYVSGSPEARGVYTSQLDGTATRRLFEADSAAAYASGHLLYLRQRRMLASEFDAERVEVKGVPFTTGIEGVVGDLVRGGLPAISVAPGGVIAYRVGSGGADRQFVWFDRSGKEMEMVGGRDDAGPLSPNLSPDGRQLALLRRVNGNADVWLLEVRRGLLSPFTNHAAEDIFPIWCRNGSQIVFSSNRSGEMGIYQKRSTGADGEALILPTIPGELIFASDCSTDGQFLLYETRSRTTKGDLWAVPLSGEHKPLPVVEGTTNDRDGQFSPDGKWVAYTSNRSGRFEVYVQPFPGPGAANQVSTGGGAQMRWQADGRELFFIALDGRLMAAPIKFGADGASAGVPVSLFATRIGRVLQGNPGAQYIVSNDGQRFLMNTIVRDGGSTSIRLILNWKPTR